MHDHLHFLIFYWYDPYFSFYFSQDLSFIHYILHCKWIEEVYLNNTGSLTSVVLRACPQGNIKCFITPSCDFGLDWQRCMMYFSKYKNGTIYLGWWTILSEYI